MKKLGVTIGLVLCCTFSLAAQTKTFKWAAGLCEYEGTYDSAKYTEKQIKDTYELMSAVGSIPLLADSTASKIEDIQTLNTTKLDKEYREALAKLKNLDVVKTDYWQQIRQAKIDELDQYYALSKVSIGAYKNPSVLKSYKGAGFCVGFYAEPLIRGGDYLYATWLKVNMDSRLRNASPGRLKGIFDSQNASPDRLNYAQVEVMSFGWWNCAIKTMPIMEHDEQITKNFNKLFIKVKEDCDDEP